MRQESTWLVPVETQFQSLETAVMDALRWRFDDYPICTDLLHARIALLMLREEENL